MSIHNAELQAMRDHRISDHRSDDGSLVWCECTCGFVTKKRDNDPNWSMYNSAREGLNHRNSEIGKARHDVLFNQ